MGHALDQEGASYNFVFWWCFGKGFNEPPPSSGSIHLDVG